MIEKHVPQIFQNIPASIPRYLQQDPLNGPLDLSIYIIALVIP